MIWLTYILKWLPHTFSVCVFSYSVISDSLWPQGLYSPVNSPGRHTGVASLSLLQRIFLTQESNPGLLHCGQILYQLSHKGSPKILEWVAFPFSRGSSWLRNRTGVSCIAGRFFTNWAIREAPCLLGSLKIWLTECGSQRSPLRIPVFYW